MKRRLDKIIFGIEAIIYGVIIIGILSSVWDYKYAKVGDWKGFLGCLIIGDIIPFLGIVAANVLLYKKKTKEIIVDELFIIYVNDSVLSNKINYNENGPIIINSLDKNEHNKETKHTDWAEVFAVSVIVGGIISVLVNLIAPWFIPTVWPKFAVVFTFFGICFVFKALDDNSNKKIYEILGWGGVIAILLSTILTIYGLFGGFSVAEDSSGNTIVSIASEKDCNLKKLDNAVVINDQSSIEGSLSIDDRNNSQVDSSQQEPVFIEQTEKLKTIEKKPKVKIMTKEEQFRNARKNEDWNSLKKLGEEGYTPAYGILARHYMNNKKYELAHEYAQKAKNAGISEGDTILKELTSRRLQTVCVI